MSPHLRYATASPRRNRFAGMTGLQVLQALIDGKLPAPPIAQTLSFWLVEVGDGLAVFEADTGAASAQPSGRCARRLGADVDRQRDRLCGAYVAACGRRLCPVETKANFTRPIKQDTGRVRAEGRVVSRGRQIMTAEARILDADKRAACARHVNFNGARQRKGVTKCSHERRATAKDSEG